MATSLLLASVVVGVAPNAFRTLSSPVVADSSTRWIPTKWPGNAGDLFTSVIVPPSNSPVQPERPRASLVLSLTPTRMRLPSGVKATDAAPASGFSINVHRGRHTRTLASSPAVTTMVPPEANTPEPTPSLCPLSTSTSMGCLSASSFHSRAVPSVLVDSRTLPEGSKLRLVTRPVWPRNDVDGRRSVHLRHANDVIGSRSREVLAVGTPRERWRVVQPPAGLVLALDDRVVRGRDGRTGRDSRCL